MLALKLHHSDLTTAWLIPQPKLPGNCPLELLLSHCLELRELLFLISFSHVVSHSLLLQPKQLKCDAHGKFKSSEETSGAIAIFNIPWGPPHKVARMQVGLVKDKPITSWSCLD